jgi:hypothetical protein
MKYWSSGEVESSIGDSFRVAMNFLEEKINSLLIENNYDSNDIDCLDVIYIIVKEGGVEKLSYKPKAKEIDIRVVVSFEDFLNALPKIQISLLLNCFLSALERVVKEKKINKFDIDRFRNDINRIFINDSN